jgi:Sec-independent protein translocase protein TatA
MESAPTDRLKKRWFVEGLLPALRKKMKIVPPSSYTEAYNRAMDLESEQKTSKKKKKNRSSDSDDSSSDDSSSDEDGNKKVRALQKDMLRMMKEFKNMQKSPGQTREGELWCTDCKTEGHTKGSCPKK